MLCPTALLFAIAVALAYFGWRTANGSGSADERIGGAIFYLAAGVTGAAGVLWWVIAVTIKAFF